MPLDSYGGLKTEILNWLARPDDPLVAPSVPTMIRLFEAEAARRLRVGALEQVTGTIYTIAGQDWVALPPECIEVRDIWVYGPGGGARLQFMPPGTSPAYWAGTGMPGYYTIYGGVGGVDGGMFIGLGPIPDQAYQVVVDYISALPPLSDLAPTNNLFARAPDLYLFGSLVEAELYIGHDERIQMWLGRREAAFESIQQADNKARWPGGLQIRVDWGPTTTSGSAIVQVEGGMITGVFGNNGLVGGGNDGTVTLSLESPVSIVRGGTGNASLPGNVNGPSNITGLALQSTGSQLVSQVADAYGAVGFSGLSGGVQCYGNNTSDGPFVGLYRFNGTLTTPTTMTANQTLGAVYFDGFNGAGYSDAATYIKASATHDWTGSATGSYLTFATTTPGATTPADERAYIIEGVIIGEPTGGDAGPGTLNAVVVKANNVTLTSDAGVKADIAPLPAGLDLVNAIEPKQYRFVEPDPPPRRVSNRFGDQRRLEGPAFQARAMGPPGFFEKEHWGFIAQDVAMAMRDAGHDTGMVDGKEGAQSLSVGDMMAVLWKAVQELSAEVKALRGS